MKTIQKLLVFFFAFVLLAGCSQKEEASMVEDSASILKAGKNSVIESVTGSGHFTRSDEPYAGSWRTFSISATKKEDGTVMGTYQIHNHKNLSFVKGKIHDFTIIDNQAVLTVTLDVYRSSVGYWDYDEYGYIVVEDNGQGKKSLPDRITNVLDTDPLTLDYEQYFLECESGNITIHTKSRKCGMPFTDARDGHSYETVLIGDQCWMAKNLAYLPSVSPPSIGSLNDPNCYVYGYEGYVVSEAKATDNFLTYGVLYSWHAAMNGESSSDAVPSGVQGICPSGWHLPSDSEWQQLKDYLTNNGFSGIEGSALTSTSGWYENGNGTDDFNFTGLPGGFLDDGANDGFFTDILESCIWTSSTRKSDGTSPHAYYWKLFYNDNNLNRGDDGFDDGYSIRCIKD